MISPVEESRFPLMAWRVDQNKSVEVHTSTFLEAFTANTTILAYVTDELECYSDVCMEFNTHTLVGTIADIIIILLMYRNMCTLDKKSFAICVAIAVVAIIGRTYFPYEVSNEPSTPLYGRERERERNELLDEILVKSNKVIEVVGITGVGKTLFVRNAAEKLTSKYGYCVMCLNIHNISSVLNHLINVYKCGFCLLESQAYDNNDNTKRSIFLSFV